MVALGIELNYLVVVKARREVSHKAPLYGTPTLYYQLRQDFDDRKKASGGVAKNTKKPPS
jgi:hypothetical protein